MSANLDFSMEKPLVTHQAWKFLAKETLRVD
jgi:hypothetical protein